MEDNDDIEMSEKIFAGGLLVSAIITCAIALFIYKSIFV